MVRPLSALVLLLALASCGGGETTSPPAPPPPPPPGPKAPAALELKAGDGQAAAPGSPVTVAPSVLVKDVDGRAVPNVTVTFAVDSGAGQVVNPTAVTDASGIASSGVWTLGPTEITNVLIASVAGAGSVKWRANARYPDVTITDTVVSSGGGPIAYRKAGDPLDGLTVTVPSGAYPGPQNWKLVGQRSLKVTLPEGVTQIGGGISIANDQGYSDSLVAIKIPMRSLPDTAVAAFLYDPVTHYLEMIPVVARDASSLTVTTPHVGSRFLWQPGTDAVRAASISRGAPLDPVTIVVAAIPATALAAPTESGFRPGVDDWEFANRGSFVSPGGSCLGMSVTAMYYYVRVKSGAGRKLYGRYDLVPNFDWDNPQGIRFAGAVQKRYLDHASVGAAQEAKIVSLAATSGVALDVLMYQSLVVAIKTTKRPQLFAMDKGPRTGGHAVVAYATGGGTVKLADPNQPGTPGVTATFSGGRFQPVNLSPKAGASADVFSRVLVIGSSSYIPTTMVDAEWQHFKQGKAGDDVFPAVGFEVKNPLNDAFEPVGDSVSVWADEIGFYVNCSLCQPRRTLAFMHDRQGKTLADNPIPTDQLGGRDSLGIRSKINDEFVNFHWTLVKSSQFDLALSDPTDPNERNADKPITFVARPFGNAPTNARYVWNFGDATAPITKTTDSTVVHTFAKEGQFEVRVELHDQAGELLAKASETFTIGVLPTLWRFTRLTLENFEALGLLVPSPGPSFEDQGGVTNSDHVTWYRADSALIKQISDNPKTGLLVLIPRPGVLGGKEFRAGFYLQSDPSGIATKFDPARPSIPLARAAKPPYTDEYVDILVEFTNGVEGSAVVETRDFTGLPATLVGPQGKRTLLAWKFEVDYPGTSLTGTMERWQSLWVYLPQSAAHGMYWYNKIHHEISFDVTAVSPAPTTPIRANAVAKGSK